MAETYANASAYSYVGSKNALGGLPVVESTKAYIATFKGVVSADPEVIANSSFFITYLVDEDGNIFKVSEDSEAQSDVQFNFDPGENAIVRIDQGTLLNAQLSGKHKITSLGSFLPILVTQTGSSNDAGVAFVNFLNPGQITAEEEGSSVKNLLGTAFVSGGINNPVPPRDSFNNNRAFYAADGSNITDLGPQMGIENGVTTLYDPKTWITSSRPDPVAAIWNDGAPGTENNESSGSYVFQDPKPDFTTLTFKVSAKFRNFTQYNIPVEVVLIRKRNGAESSVGSVLTNLTRYTYLGYIKGEPVGSVPISPIEATFTLNSQDVEATDEYRVIIGLEDQIDNYLNDGNSGLPTGNFGGRDAPSIYYVNESKTFADGSSVIQPEFYFRAFNQNPVVEVAEPQPDFFTVGGNTSNVLTASQDLSDEYGNFQVLPTASGDFGFSPINNPFEVQPGDQIRFTFNQDNIFTIFKVQAPPTTDRLYLTLDRAPGTEINLRNFVLYRTLPDGKFITLDIFKNDPTVGETDFTGIIIPEFASPKLKANASEIVSKLKQDGIIED